MKLSGQYPPYLKDVQAGYDKSAGRFRDQDGNRISKAKYLELQLSDYNNNPNLHMVQSNYFSAPLSRDFEKLESIIGSSKPILDPNRPFQEFAKHPDKAWPMPQDILTAMRLSEYFYRTEGDVAYALQVPREILFAQQFDIKSPSSEIQRTLTELYDQDQLDIFQLMKDADSCESVYGNAFPLVLPSGKNDSPIAGVTLLNPKFVYVGTPVASDAMVSNARTGEPLSSEAFTSTFGLLSQTEAEWNSKVLKNEIHPLAYNAFGPRWNEQDVRGLWIDLNPKYLKPIQVNKQRWERYATPYLARAFRAITNRKVFEELRRATAEGYKSQLFMFNVGTPEHPGSIEELTIISSVLNSLAPERTGMLLGRGNLSGNVLHMDALEGMLAEATWHNLTLTIFRNLGMNIRFISGENLGGARSSDAELDMMVFAERMAFKQKILARWERWFRLTLAQLMYPNDEKYLQAMRDTTVVFQKPMVEMASYIKSVLMPLFTIGAMSLTTLHEKAQMNHAAEVANRKSEKSSGEDDLFMPRTTFVQQTVNPEGGSKTGGQADPSTDPRNTKNPMSSSVEGNRVDAVLQELRHSRELLTVISALEQKQPTPVTIDFQGLKQSDTIVSPPQVHITNQIPEQPAPKIDVKVEAAQPPSVTVNVPEQLPPKVDIHVPVQEIPKVEVHVPVQEAPKVDVHLPTQEAPKVDVHVAAAEAPKVEIHVPEMPAPQVVVNTPKARRKRTKIERDSDGTMTGSTEDVEYE